MDYRFFKVTDGPVMESFLTLMSQRKAASGAITKFMRSVGAVQCYGVDAASYLFDFKNPNDVDKNVWAKTKPRRGTYYFRPARTPAGREMLERIRLLPMCPSLNSCMEATGLMYQFPVLIQGDYGYTPHLRYWSVLEGFLIIQVPWRDVHAKEMDKYKRDHAKGIHSSAEMEYLQWVPIESLHEIKEWEALKLMDDLLNKGDKT